MSKQNRPDDYSDLEDDELVRRRRINAILDSRQKVDETIQDSEDYIMSGIATIQEANRAILAAVQTYLRRTRGYLLKSGYEDVVARDIVGYTPISPPGDEATLQSVDNLPTEHVSINDGAVVWHGTASIRKANPSYSAVWQVQEQTHMHGIQTKEKETIEDLPRSLAMAAVEQTDDALQNSPLTLQLRDNKEYEHDYSHLIEE